MVGAAKASTSLDRGSDDEHCSSEDDTHSDTFSATNSDISYSSPCGSSVAGRGVVRRGGRRRRRRGRQKQNSGNEPGGGLLFTFQSCHSEDHGSPLFGVSFNPYLHGEQQAFATVGSLRVTIYQCEPDGRIEALLCFEDSNKDELFYCCCWAYLAAEKDYCVAAGGKRGIIHIFSTNEAKLLKSFIGHGHSINELSIHPTDIQLMLSASKDQSIRLWNIVTEQCVAVFAGVSGHRDEVLSADFDALGDRIASCSMDHTVKLWRITDNPKVANAIKRAAEFPKAKRTLRPIHVDYSDFTTRDVHTNYIDCIRWLGDFCVSKSCENCIVIWKVGNLVELEPAPGETNVALLCSFKIPRCQVWFLRFAIDRHYKYLACGNLEGKIYVWNLLHKPLRLSKPYILECTQPKCSRTIRQLAFSPNGHILVAVCDDATIWRWEIGERRPVGAGANANISMEL